MCYSDHDHDIEMVGTCEMCGSNESIGRFALDKARKDADRWLRILS